MNKSIRREKAYDKDTYRAGSKKPKSKSNYICEPIGYYLVHHPKFITKQGA